MMVCLVGVRGGHVAPSFECDACHRQLRLTDRSVPAQAAAYDLLRALATLGHQGVSVDVAVHGTCSSCLSLNCLTEQRP